MTRSNRLISLLTGALVAFLALAAFRLSFDALRHLAAANGIDADRAWLYPAIIDGAIIIFSLSVLQAGLNRERTRYPWALVGLFTILSIGLNILHAPSDPLPRLLAAIPPIALFLSFELLMNQVKSMVRRLGSMQSLGELETAVRKKKEELDTLIASKQTELDAIVQERQTAVEKLGHRIEQLTTQKDLMRTELLNLKEDIRREKRASGHVNLTKSTPKVASLADANAVRLTNKDAAMRQLLAYLDEHPDATITDAADQVGRSRSTVSGYVAQLTTDGRLHKNGHGWEVLDAPSP